MEWYLLYLGMHRVPCEHIGKAPSPFFKSRGRYLEKFNIISFMHGLNTKFKFPLNYIF